MTHCSQCALWEGPFEVSPIQRENYQLAWYRYVEMNPVREGMVAGSWHYRRSSYREGIGLVES